MRKLLMASGLSAITLSSLAASPSLYQSLYDQIAAQQVPQSTSLQISNHQAISWEKQAGLYGSYVRLNFVGGTIPTLMRHDFSIFDNNFFVTAWVLESLIHSYELQPGSFSLTSGAMNNALTAETTFYDKNNPDTSLVTFWPQKKVKGYYQASPQNLETVLGDTEAFMNELLKVCELRHTEAQCKGFIKNLPFLANLSSMQDAFHIPSDSDDSSLNLSLGAMLYAHRSDPLFSTAYQTWASHNPPKKMKNALLQFIGDTYQPSSQDLDNDLIDPRTFYAMHQYAFSAPQDAFPLLTTWTEKLSDEQQQIAKTGLKYPVFAMPLNVNNVDPSVEANFIYAIGSLDKSGLLSQITAGDKQFQSQLDQLIVNSANYIAWVINNNLTLKRPDITVLYYPSKYNLYWFTSRIINLYALIPSQDPNINTAVTTLNKALTTTATQALLNTVVHDDKASYWDDFLGDADTDPHTKKPLAEDRLFSTAIATNALLNIWTRSVSTINPKRIWLSDAPDNVKQTVSSAVAWLKSNILTDNYRKDNAFFSGSVKGIPTLPFVYPANFYQFLNGKPFTPGKELPDDDDLIYALRYLTLPSADDYNQMIKEKHFGYNTPTTFSGFNDKESPFPFWTAPVLTYAFSLEAIMTYDAI